MKILTKLISFLFFSLAFIACKKKYPSEFIGPQGKEEINVVVIDSLKANLSTPINFRLTPVIPVFFNAKLDKSINWKLTIVGDTSGATKTFIGTSSQIDSLTSLWRGEQDSLYFFTKETCTVTLADYNPVISNSTYNTLIQNSDIIVPAPKFTCTLKISIDKPKLLPDNAVAIFDLKNKDGKKGSYGVFYDSENCISDPNNHANEEANPTVFYSPGVLTCLSKESLPLSKNGGPIYRFRTESTTSSTQPANSPYYFVLKGTDSYNSDYYIGRIERPRTDGISYDVFLDNNKGVSPENLWFNVFVYGTGDGAKLNYTVKEDEDGPNGGGDSQFNKGRTKPCGATKQFLDSLKVTAAKTMDDAFEHAINLDFKGWKLISVPYKDFDLVPQDGLNSNGKGVHNPDNIYAIQFSLVAPKPGGAGYVIFDYPVMTIGGPLKY